MGYQCRSQASSVWVMDEFKANMISHWVENQAGKEDNNAPLYLTQFKQADSDSGSEKQEPTTKAQVHAANPSQTETVQSIAVTPGQQEMRSARKLAPPPPPRKTPPKGDKAETSGECGTNASSNTGQKLSPRGEVEGSDSPEPLQEPHSLDDIFIQCEKLVDSLNKEGTCGRGPEKVTRSEMGHIDSVELIEVEERNKDIPMIDNGCQVTEEDIETSLTAGSFQFNSGTAHPLRILSEENQTARKIALTLKVMKCYRTHRVLSQIQDFFTEETKRPCQRSVEQVGNRCRITVQTKPINRTVQYKKAAYK